MCDCIRVLGISHHIIVQINKLYTLDLEEPIQKSLREIKKKFINGNRMYYNL